MLYSSYSCYALLRQAAAEAEEEDKLGRFFHRMATAALYARNHRPVSQLTSSSLTMRSVSKVIDLVISFDDFKSPFRLLCCS
jgi:hypothetical protein